MTLSLLSHAFSVLHIWQKVHLTEKKKKKRCQASFLDVESLKRALGTGSTIQRPFQNSHLIPCDLGPKQLLFPGSCVVNEIRGRKYRGKRFPTQLLLWMTFWSAVAEGTGYWYLWIRTYAGIVLLNEHLSLWALKGHGYPLYPLGYLSLRQHCLEHMNMPAWQLQHVVMVTKKVPAPAQSTTWKQVSSLCLTESKVAKQKNDLLKVTKQVGSRASNKYNPDVLDSTSSLHHAASLSSMLEGNVLHLLIPPFPLSIEIKAGIWLPKPWILRWFPRLAVKSANISIESSPNGQLKAISLPTGLSVQNSSKHMLLLYR